jgi:hypothetical protein
VSSRFDPGPGVEKEDHRINDANFLISVYLGCSTMDHIKTVFKKKSAEVETTHDFICFSLLTNVACRTLLRSSLS